jgi:hypothetical protein
VRRPTRIVLVGAGERARATIIPAIHASGPRLELVAVCARSERTIDLLGGRFRAPTSLLADVDLTGVDAVVVSVGTKSVPAVLGQLADRGGTGSTLMLDTPVLDPSNLRAARLFERFRAVLASEDNYSLPLYVLTRRLLDEGRVGRLQRAYLFHSGYRHHALAALGRLTGTRARRVSVERSNRWCAEVHVSFPGGVRALVLEPRRYEAGRTMIVGESGFVADYPIDHRKGVRIGYRTGGDRFRGLTVDDEPVPPTELDDAFSSSLDGAPLEDPSLMNQMKIRGLMELLAGLGDPRSAERYPAVDAIEDNLTMHFAERLRVAPARGALLRTAGRVAAPFARSGGEET